MIKISRNLKKFRKLNNLTQEQLAEEMNLTRQAISNWENDKSQPDLESIERLSSIFGISVEELIYGDLKKVGVDENTGRKINIMKIVLSVLGGLFLAAGLVVLFVAFWEDFPDFIKSAFAFLPLTAGLAFALFVFLKKKDSRIWCEIGAVVWCVGLISSYSLVGESFGWFEYNDTLQFLITILLCTPALFIFKSIGALPIYFILQIIWSFNAEISIGNTEENIAVFFILPLFAVGAVFTHFLKRDNSDVKYKFAVWISAIAFAITNIALYSNALDGELAELGMLLLFLSYFLISAKDGIYGLPFKIFGSVGICVMSAVSIYFSDYMQPVSCVTEFFVIVFSIALLVASIIFTLVDFKPQFSDVLLFISIGILIITNITLIFIDYYEFSLDSGNYEDYFKYAEYITGLQMFGVACVAMIGISFIIKGIDELTLFELNIGIITLFTAIIILTSSLFSFDLFVIGVLLVFFGVAMFLANLLVSKKKRSLTE